MTSPTDPMAPPPPSRPQRTAEWALVCGLAGLALLLAGSALGLLLAPKDDSTLGVMRALVFRCH
jgi:hypothetical protein